MAAAGPWQKRECQKNGEDLIHVRAEDELPNQGTVAFASRSFQNARAASK